MRPQPDLSPPDPPGAQVLFSNVEKTLEENDEPARHSVAKTDKTGSAGPFARSQAQTEIQDAHAGEEGQGYQAPRFVHRPVVAIHQHGRLRAVSHPPREPGSSGATSVRAFLNT